MMHERVSDIDAAGHFVSNEEIHLWSRTIAMRDALLRGHEEPREVLVALGKEVVVDLAMRQCGNWLKYRMSVGILLSMSLTLVRFLRSTKE